MNETRVVSIRSGEPYDVYIGRANWSRRLPRSMWMNPYRIGRHGTRDEVIEKYRQHVLSAPDLLGALTDLRGKVLACWCSPEGGITASDPLVCHGQVLAELADQSP